MSKRRLRFIFVSILFLLTACGSGSSGSSGDPSSGGSSSGSSGDPSSGGSTTSSGLPNDINGLLVLNVRDAYNHRGIHKIDFNKGEVKSHRFLTSKITGINPYAYDRNTITYAEPCGSGPYEHSRIKIITEKALSSKAIIPCSTEIIKRNAVYAVAKISPDKSKIALEIDNGDERDLGYVTHYIVAVFDRKTEKMLYYHDGYNSPEWLPDGRLLMVPNIANDKQGIFIASKDFKKLTRIDGGEINQNLFFLSVNPSGDKLVFTMSGALWMMNIESNHTLSNLQELVSDSTSIQTPTWSPKGNYIAFLSYNGSGRSIWTAGGAYQYITFWNVNSKKPYVFNLTTAFPNWQEIHDRLYPATYLSWVK